MKPHQQQWVTWTILTLAIIASVFAFGQQTSRALAADGVGGASDRAASPPAASTALPTDQIIIKYKPSVVTQGSWLLFNPAGAGQMGRLSSAAGVSLNYQRAMSSGAHVLRLAGRLPLEQVQAISERLNALPEVEYALPDQIRTHTLFPDDEFYGSQWHYYQTYGINAPAAWDITTGDASIVVAVIDTGITNHADLAGRTVPGYDFIHDEWVANDGNGRDSDPSDPGDWILEYESWEGYFAGCPVTDSSWHGTHIAGTIGAASDNGQGVSGINWNSKILPVRVLGKCGGYDSDIIDGMRWAAGLAVSGVPANPNPAKVLNISLGGPGGCDATYQNAINAITAAGAVVVVAAGNENADASGSSPGNCNGVITVAATDRLGSPAYYSNYGSLVEISAPGGAQSVDNDPNGILSTSNTGATSPVADTYLFYQGTSMAAPHVSGVVSLMLSLNPALTPAQVLDILQRTAKAFPAGSTCTTALCGSGIVDAGAAVSIAQKPAYFSKTSPVSAADGVSINPTLSWGSSSLVERYEYCVDTSDDDACADSWASAGLSTSVTLSGLPYTTTYSWQVRAHNAVSDTYADYGEWWAFTTEYPHPPNDDFDAAEIIPSTHYTHTINTTRATRAADDPILPCAARTGDKSIWYQFTPPFDGVLSLDTFGSDYDTVLGVWTGSRGSLVTVGCNDDDNPLAGADYASSLQVSVVVGQTYSIEIVDFNSSGGFLVLHANLATHEAFDKTNPEDGALSQPTNPTLRWGSSSGALSYEYCLDTSDDSACAGSWVSVGITTSIQITGLATSTTYTWQVRAVSTVTTTYANEDHWWRFTTLPGTPSPAFVELISTGSDHWYSSSNADHTCGVKTSGSLPLAGNVACWGSGSPGSSGAQNYGQASPPSGTFTQISTGYFHTCGIRNDGALICWGESSDGKLIPPAGTFIQVSAGRTFTCGLKSDGSLTCWGLWSWNPAGTFIQVSAGSFHACGVKSDGMVTCGIYTWDVGQASPPGGTFTQVSAGLLHSCGIKNDGTLACWGFNGSGQASPPAGTFIQVSAGSYHSCGIKSDGTLACWGSNDYSQTSPPTGTYTQVNAAERHTCALRSDGDVLCWGDNAHGQLYPKPEIKEGSEITVTMSEDGLPVPFDLTLHAWDWNDTFAWSIPSPAAHGTASASGAGASQVISYFQNFNYSGTDSFIVQVSNGATTDSILVNVVIKPINDPPVIVEGASVSVIMDEDGAPTPFDLTLHVADADVGEVITWSLATPASHGAVNLSGVGLSRVVGYIPDADYFGSDSFVVQVADGEATDSITVNVTIHSIPDITGNAGVGGVELVSNYSTLPSQNDMVSFWKFDESNGNTAGDSVDGNAGTISGATWAAGRTSSALSFDGNVVIIPDAANLTLPDQVSVEAWVNIRAFRAWNEYETIITKWKDRSPESHNYFLGLHGTAASFLVGINGGIQEITSQELQTGQWYHLAGTYDGAMLKLYVNGILANSLAASGPLWTGATPVYIGNSLDMIYPAHFMGLIDEVALFNKALTAEQIYKDYQYSLLLPTTVVADSQGNYTLNVPDNWSGTVTPWLPGYIFAPGSRTYSNVLADQTDQDYTATPVIMATGLSAGSLHTCGLQSGGRIAAVGSAICWGAGSPGWPYGDPHYGQSTPPAGNFTQISSGGTQTCAIKTDGTLACWGWDYYGQASPPGGTFTQLDSGGAHNCALRTDGTIACWGWNGLGETVPPAGTFLYVDVGIHYSCALKNDSRLVCWGRNDYGQSSPPSYRFIQFSAGGFHACAIKGDGSIACWGRNDDGQSTPPGGAFTQVSAGQHHSCGLKNDGTLACWGLNDYGQATPPSGTFSLISACGWHTCGLRTDGNVICWGRNDYGQLDPRPEISEGDSITRTMSEDSTPTPFDLTLNAWNLNNAAMTWSISTAPAHAAAGASGMGTSKVITYTPSANYTGPDSFVVQVADGAAIDRITVNVTIEPLNDAPLITEGTVISVTMDEDGAPVPFSLTLHATDPDVDDTLTWSISIAPVHGAASANGAGASAEISYIPVVNYNGSDSFIVQVSDGESTDVITVNVTIQSIPDISGNAGVGGATLSYTDGITKTATADASGDYAFTVSYNWSGTVTPSKPGYTFTPASRTYANVLANQTDQDYAATAIVFLSGNAGVDGATLTYTDGTRKTATADAGGNYSFTVLYNWSGTVTPSKAGYTFTPASRTYSNVLADQTDQDYAATAIVFTLSGNAGVSGATLTYTDGTTKTATADANGDYAFTVSYNWSGVVTPSKPGYTFTPASRAYANVLADQTDQDYAATPIVFTLSGNAGVDGATLSYTDGTAKTATAVASGDYSFTVSYNWSGTVTPSKAGYTFAPTNRTYSNVLADQTDQDYSATPIVFTLSGNAGVDGPTLGYTDGTPKTATADASGYYSFTVSYNWSGTVTPSMPGYTFTPANRTYTNVLTDQTDQDYSATPIVFTLSGNAGVDGATLSYTDGTTKTATADASGDYSFTVSYNWSGVVTPSMPGYTFTPANRAYTNVLTDQTDQDYTATPIVFTISGNAGMGRVKLSYTDGTAKTATADASGYYSLTVSYNWSGVVTPSMPGYTFTPASRAYANVLADQTDQNYTATDITYTLSGNAGVDGATLSYTDGTAKTATADANGDYAFTVSYNWSGTVTPSRPGYTFTPASRTYSNVLADQTDQDYSATPIVFTLSGNVGVDGATLSYTDGTTKTATADASGYYSFTVPYNWSGTVTPFKPGYTFTPPCRTYTNVLADQIGQDYTATPITYSISGSAGVGGATLGYTDGTTKTATADASGYYSFTVSYNWSGEVTPAKTGYTFTPASRAYANVLADQTDQDYTATPIVFTLSGNAGVDGATLGYTDGTPKTATTDANGDYSLTVSYNWSGVVIPSMPGYTFTPASRAYANVLADQTDQDYTATSITYTLSGNAGVDGATLGYTDGTPKTATADASGDYAFTVSYNWSGTVTPTKPGYTFTPESRTYANVLADQTDQDYAATPIVFTLSGNAGVDGATLSYTDGTAKTATADASGDYAFTVSYNWSGTVTPSKAGYTFTPPSRTYSNVLADLTGQDYMANPITYTISGNAGVGGATLSYTDGTTKTATADTSGDYAFTVSYNWSGVVTPFKPGYLFTPASRTYSNVLANLTGQDYTARTPNIYLPLVQR